jgi:hypothetical protein
MALFSVEEDLERIQSITRIRGGEVGRTGRNLCLKGKCRTLNKLQ